MKSDSRLGRIVLFAILAAGIVSAGINEWTNGGPEGLGATFLVFDPQDPATLYTGTAVGLFKSIDGGANWTNTGLIGCGVGSLAMIL